MTHAVNRNLEKNFKINFHCSKTGVLCNHSEQKKEARSSITLAPFALDRIQYLQGTTHHFDTFKMTNFG